MNTEPLDPTKTDQSELIIDPEAITQWVDGKLPTPHRLSVELLAEKFGSLNDYDKDVKEIRELINTCFSPRITAPAHTICRVLMAIKNEQTTCCGGDVNAETSCGRKPDTDRQTDSKQQKAHSSGSLQQAVAPASVRHHHPRSLDSLPFEIHFPQQRKKRNRYIFPAAAVFLLTLLVGVIVFSENYSGHVKTHKHQSISETTKGKKHWRDRKAAIMTAPSHSPHAVPVADNVQMTNDDEIRSPHDENETQNASQKKEEEARKEKEKKTSAPSSPKE